jgi:hypothetical protein
VVVWSLQPNHPGVLQVAVLVDVVVAVGRLDVVVLHDNWLEVIAKE